MKIWIYKDGAQQGPFDYESLPSLGITPDTKVWFSGMPKWAPAGEVPELQPLFEAPAAPQPPAAPPEACCCDAGDGADTQPGREYAAPEQQGYDPQQYEPQQPVAPQQYEPQQGYEYCTCEAPAQNVPEQEPCPPSYLSWAIVLTVLCCSPLTIAAILTSVYTGVYYRRGDMRNARRASEATAWLIMISIALGVLPSMLFTLML